MTKFGNVPLAQFSVVVRNRETKF